MSRPIEAQELLQNIDLLEKRVDSDNVVKSEATDISSKNAKNSEELRLEVMLREMLRRKGTELTDEAFSTFITDG